MIDLYIYILIGYLIHIVEVIQKFAKAHSLRISSHVNEEVSKLFTTSTTVRRLKRTFPQDLVPKIN